MTNNLHHNSIVLLDRIHLNLFFTPIKWNDDSCMDCANKVLKRALEFEKKHNVPCMEVPIRVYELKKLFPDYLEHPEIWKKGK